MKRHSMEIGHIGSPSSQLTQKPRKKRSRKETKEAEEEEFVQLPGASNGFFDQLPEDVLVRILQNLSLADLLTLGIVSKTFYIMTSHIDVWDNLYRQYFLPSHNLLKYLYKNRNGVPKRHWKIEFQKKYTERRCHTCGVVYNMFNINVHTHGSPERQITAAKETNNKRKAEAEPPVFVDSDSSFNEEVVEEGYAFIDPQSLLNLDDDVSFINLLVVRILFTCW